MRNSGGFEESIVDLNGLGGDLAVFGRRVLATGSNLGGELRTELGNGFTQKVCYFVLAV